MLKVGDRIRFGKRRGTVVSHAKGQTQEVNTYYIVELDADSGSYR